MMFKTLLSRISFTLVILLLAVCFLLVQIIQSSNVRYQQEVSQKLNKNLAKHIVKMQPLLEGSEINQQKLDALFNNLMMVNPSIELYLLSPEGKIIDFYAPEDKVKRDTISIEPIKQFLKGNYKAPLKGDDPRQIDTQKVFSAAPIFNQNNQIQCYLYIVLGGEQYDDIAMMLKHSYSFDASITALILALLTILITGVIIFVYLTRRLRQLGHALNSYTKDQNTNIRYYTSSSSPDEIDALGLQFNTMADTINQQFEKLKRSDNLRREMVANVSHDLRTPLTAMQGYLETLLLKHNDFDAQQQQQYINTALSHSKQLNRLVEDLFQLAKLDSYESIVYSEPFSMGELVQDVIQKFQLPASQKSITLSSQITPDTPLIFGDLSMMQRVLENLIDNGIRHTPEHGKIHIYVNRKAQNVVVQISDTGCGIPSDDMPKIFERFYQRDINRTQGNNAGLGLAIVQRILELHKSTIQVSSEMNKGTTFRFEMPTQTP